MIPTDRTTINPTDPREMEIQKICKQLVELDFEENPSNSRDYCPICQQSARTLNFLDIDNHFSECAVIIAKDLRTNLI